MALFDSFSSDEGHSSKGRVSQNELRGALQELGLSPFPKMSQVVKTVTKRDFQVAIPKVLAHHSIIEQESQPANAHVLRATLADYIYHIKGQKTHYLFIDGLDDALTRREDQYRSLAALVIAAGRVNHRLLSSKVPAKIIVICRSDLLHRLKDPNLNKIKQDNTLLLDWYQDTHDWDATHLARLVNLRASKSLSRPVSVFKDLLPVSVLGREETAKTVFENTRHLPRDLVQLMNCIQKHAGNSPVLKNQVLAGLRTYSLTYFVQEIKDELVGFLGPDEIDGALGLLTALGRRNFSFSEAKKVLSTDVRFKAKSLDALRLLNALYETGAIGNVHQTNSNGYRYSFKFRNPYSSFDPSAMIAVHFGLCKGLNIEI
jgi:hypothetical protein